jgi:hypothetical protein
MTQNQHKIAALKSAIVVAEASLQNVVDTLTLLEDAFPSPAPAAIQHLKDRFGAVAQNWTDARNYADAELREL